MVEDYPWRDEDTLRELREEGLTYNEMAEELSVHRRTIARWMSHYDLNGFLKTGPLHIFTGIDDGYVQVHHRDTEGHETCYLHQLNAIANGADPHDIFGGESDVEVHHKSRIPWHNTGENIMAISRKEHARLHTNGSNAPTAPAL